MRKSTYIAGAVVLATSLALTGCAGGTSGDDSYEPGDEVELTFTWWGNDDRAQRYGELIDAFNEEYPNITIKGALPGSW
ncbi:MAG: hypothetical protein ACTIL0_11780 [Microbacterium gubbeenense]